jgi:hypothetical protein
MESTAVFYAQIFGAASHYQLQRRGALRREPEGPLGERETRARVGGRR